jgi:hypothetical protein
MRKIIIALTILAFISCLFLGLYASNLLPAMDQESSNQSAIPSPASPFQHNIVIIHVDSLQADSPILVSIWGTILYFPEPKIILQPLFPLSDEQDSSVLSNFALTAGKEPVSAFLKKINQITQIQWDNYVIVDHNAFALLHSAISQYNGAAVTDPAASILLVESNFFNQLCTLISEQGKDFLKDFTWSEMIPTHMRTNLAIDIALVNWEKLTSANLPVRCEVFGE